jgi:hypothetical protein
MTDGDLRNFVVSYRGESKNQQGHAYGFHGPRFHGFADRIRLGLRPAIPAAAQAPPAHPEEVRLEEIVISPDRIDSFGADLVQAGTFRNALQIDTPLTVSMIPGALLKSQQATRR